MRCISRKWCLRGGVNPFFEAFDGVYAADFLVPPTRPAEQSTPQIKVPSASEAPYIIPPGPEAVIIELPSEGELGIPPSPAATGVIQPSGGDGARGTIVTPPLVCVVVKIWEVTNFGLGCFGDASQGPRSANRPMFAVRRVDAPKLADPMGKFDDCIISLLASVRGNAVDRMHACAKGSVFVGVFVTMVFKVRYLAFPDLD